MKKHVARQVAGNMLFSCMRVNIKEKVWYSQKPLYDIKEEDDVRIKL